MHRVATPGDGAIAAFYGPGWTPDGMAISVLPGPTSGLRSGDVVTAVGGRPLGEWLDRAVDPSLDRSVLDAGSIPYSIVRDGAPREVGVMPARHDVGGLLLDYWSALVLIVVLQVVASYVLSRRPGEPAAPALAIAAVGVTGSTIPWLLGVQVSDVTRGWPFLLWAATAGGLYMLLWPAGALHLPLALTSRVPPGRGILLAVYGIPLAAYMAALVVARIVSPSSVAWMGTWAVVQTAIIVPVIVVGIGLTIRGYRGAPSELRARTKWAAIGGSVSVVAGLVLFWLPQLVADRPLVPWSAIGLVALPLPLGVAAAILRYRLFDIDVVVNRTLVYGGATAAIVGVYVVSVSLLGRVLGVQAGFSASLLATGLAAVAALPIRDALQRVVNRLMYGDRDDPYRALTRLGRRLEATMDPLEAPSVIVRTVAESLLLPWVALRVGRAAGGYEAVEPGRLIVHGSRSAAQPIVVPLTYRGEMVGELLVGPRSAGETLSSADRALLDDLAPQIGAAVHALALTLDLLESRERLVATREEERRRIRRDLHDGLGPTLAAIGLRAELAADLVARDDAEAGRLLEEMRAEVRAAIADIRRLVDGLRPPALDELGLVGAIRAQAEGLGATMEVEVGADGPLPELPAAVEVAAFRIAAEAMTNAARHSGAATCRVRLRTTDGGDRGLELEVTDDGAGLPADARMGIGLASIRERAAEVGGRCEIGRGPSGGMRVYARLPLLVPRPETEPSGG